MTQYEDKLLTYLNNEHEKNGKIYFTVVELYVENSLNLGSMEIIERVVNQLVDKGVVQWNGYEGQGFTLII